MLLLNACSIKKINSTNQKGCCLLAHDLTNLNIDVCLVTETHLRPSIPNSYVTIPGFNVTRRDRTMCNCRRSECSLPHKGGGVLIYSRSSYDCQLIDCADSCESLWVKLSPPNSDSQLFVNVSYHPPNANSCALSDFFNSTIRKITNEFPAATMIIGGDFNRLDLSDVETQFGISIISSPSTRGNYTLDLFMTNKPHLIESATTFHTTLKSDHLAVILTPCQKVRPSRHKITFTDYNFKGFQYLNDTLSNLDFSQLFTMTEVDTAAHWLDQTISNLIYASFPTRTVTMSDHDPVWLTPKSKWLIQKRKKAVRRRDVATSDIIDTRLSFQKLSFLNKNNAQLFWNGVNQVTNRKVSQKSISSSNINGDLLNTELANRSAESSEKTVEPISFDPQLLSDGRPPQLQLFEVADAMRRCKRSSSGPVNIPFFTFRIFWDILAPLYLFVWNLSLEKGKFPACYKLANLNPIPKIANASKPDDIRGISITSISARLFEKLVHRKWILPNIVRLGDPLQFAYRPQLSTADCLLTLQHSILTLLDRPNVDGVHIIAVDFSKAFDRLDQRIASHKFPKFTKNDLLSQWLYNFSTKRSQRLKWEGKTYPPVNIDLGCSQGTVGGPNIFSMFTDDLKADSDICRIIKYSDDSTLVVPCFQVPTNNQASTLSKEFENICSWSNCNRLMINRSKTHHIRFCLNHHPYCLCVPLNLEDKDQINILGVTFQTNCHFSIHVKNLLNFLRRSIYIIRDLKLNSFSQDKIDQVFDSLILSRIRYCISVYGSDKHSLDKIDKLLDSCFRHGHTSKRHSAHDILQREDTRLAHNILQNTNHPLHRVLTQHLKQRTTRHNLTFVKPKTNTVAFAQSFCNRVLPL